MASWLTIILTGVILSVLALTEGATITPVCPGIKTQTVNANDGDTIVIMSPNYDDNYGPRNYCVWNLKCDNNADGAYFEWECDFFQLQNYVRRRRRRVCLDVFAIRPYPDPEQIYCGTTPPDMSQTPSGALRIKFTSNRKVNEKGFDCKATCRSPTTATTATPTTTAATTTTPTTTAAPTTTVAPTTTAAPTTTVAPTETTTADDTEGC